MTPWGDYLSQLLKARDMKPAGFARLVGVTREFVSRVMRGVPQYKNRPDGPRCLPPLDRMEAWAEALSLSDSERQKLMELAEAEHAPEAMARRYREAMARMAYLEQQVAELRRQREGR